MIIPGYGFRAGLAINSAANYRQSRWEFLRCGFAIYGSAVNGISRGIGVFGYDKAGRPGYTFVSLLTFAGGLPEFNAYC